MEQEQSLLEEAKGIYDNLLAYVRQAKDVLILDLTEKGSAIIANILASILILILSIFILVFASIALAWYIGYTIESMPMGFLIVAGIYAIVLVIVIVFNKDIIQTKIINLIINSIHGSEDQKS